MIRPNAISGAAPVWADVGKQNGTITDRTTINLNIRTGPLILLFLSTRRRNRGRESEQDRECNLEREREGGMKEQGLHSLSAAKALSAMRRWSRCFCELQLVLTLALLILWDGHRADPVGSVAHVVGGAHGDGVHPARAGIRALGAEIHTQRAGDLPV